MTYPVIEITDETTDQELFDAVVTHMLGMDGPCKDERGNCAYRGPGGTACAVGALMTDEEAARYQSGIDEVLVAYQDGFERGEVEFSPRLNRMSGSGNLLDNLQGVHDYRYSWDDKGGLGAFGARRLIGIADTFDLRAPQALLDKQAELTA